jgi:transposase
MEHTTIAVDLAKSVFQVAVSHRPGHLDEERRLSRDRFVAFFAQRPPATIVLEACGSAQLLGSSTPTVRARGSVAPPT